MDDGKTFAAACFLSLLALWVMQSRELTRMRREIDLLVKGDLETLKLKRKLEGYPDTED